MQSNEKPEVVAINWEGFEAHAEGIPYATNPYRAEPFKRALWSKGWCDGQHGRPAPETAFDAYWIVDDVMDGQTKEGFQVYFGCPFRAIGAKQGEYGQLGLALASVTATEAVYRVKLARRHGEHSVTLIRNAGETKKGRARLGGRAIYDPAKAFDQPKITWEGLMIKALEDHGGLDRSDAQSVLEVHITLADALYQNGERAEVAAAKILVQPVHQPT